MSSYLFDQASSDVIVLGNERKRTKIVKIVPGFHWFIYWRKNVALLGVKFISFWFAIIMLRFKRSRSSKDSRMWTLPWQKSDVKCRFFCTRQGCRTSQKTVTHQSFPSAPLAAARLKERQEGWPRHSKVQSKMSYTVNFPILGTFR